MCLTSFLLMSRSNDQQLERILADAIFEYLERGMVDELEADIAYLIDREIKQYQEKIKVLKSARCRFTRLKLHLLVNEDE